MKLKNTQIAELAGVSAETVGKVLTKKNGNKWYSEDTEKVFQGFSKLLAELSKLYMKFEKGELEV